MVWIKQVVRNKQRGTQWLQLGTSFMACLLLAACQMTPPRGESAAQEINKTLQESSQQAQAAEAKEIAPPPAVSAALLPPLNVELSGVGQTPVERRFDITVNRSSARSFFMNLVKDTPYNMVVHPSVTGRISLSMKNVTVDEVMQTVRSVYGYEYEHTATGYEVLPGKLRSQVFKLDYLNVRREGVSQVRVSSGQVTETNNNNDNGDNTSQSNGTVSGSQVQTQSASDFWAELSKALKAIVGSEDGRQVVINPQSGIVVVRAMPAELRAVEEYLNATQNVIQRQVILEAKILEVELSDGFQSGINWAAIGRDGSDSILAGQFGGSSLLETGASNLSGQSDALNPNNLSGVRSDMASAFGGMFAMSLNLGDFSGFLEFLKTQGDVHVLSSPRVSTVNNQKAVIKVGTDEFFVTDVDTQSDTTAAATSSQSIDVQLTPFFSGVALDVIPQISERGEVTLHIHPSVSEVSERIKEINLTQTTNMSIPLALSTIRESDSIVRARSGQVVVIGGLMQNQTKDTTASVPLLGDLPLVGGLFRHKQQVMRKSELVILLRPVVIDGAKTWANELKRSTSAFGALSQLDNENGNDVSAPQAGKQ